MLAGGAVKAGRVILLICFGNDMRANMRIAWCVVAWSICLIVGAEQVSVAEPQTSIAAPQASPTYTIEAVEISGNTKTNAGLIRRELTVRKGAQLSVDSPLFEQTRYRLLALGYFSDVRLRLKKGSEKGHVVLVVEVVERGTIVLTDLFLGTSEATTAWGGVGLAERNLLGRGIGVEAAFVLGADPNVERGQIQQAYWLRLDTPRILDWPAQLTGSFLFVDGNEFFQSYGPDGSSAPENYLSILYRRIGGGLGVSTDMSSNVRLQVDYRVEGIKADVPWGAVREREDGTHIPIDFGIHNGTSFLSVFAITLERDTRSDPFLPETGSLLSVSGDFSTLTLGSSYSYAKITAAYRKYFPLSWKHIVAMDLFGGIVFGEAPFFERFFIGDLNDLVPSRALGLNFSTLPSRNFFGTSIDLMRYEDLALRTSVEYIIPWFRRSGFFYVAEFFLNAGLLVMASKNDVKFRDVSFSESFPIDMTLDVGIRLDSKIGIFRFSLGNALGRIPF